LVKLGFLLAQRRAETPSRQLSRLPRVDHVAGRMQRACRTALQTPPPQPKRRHDQLIQGIARATTVALAHLPTRWLMPLNDKQRVEPSRVRPSTDRKCIDCAGREPRLMLMPEMLPSAHRLR
jgi:hypothetical protein